MIRRPTDELILEVLAARHRLGESIWPFAARLRQSLQRLGEAGLIGWKSGAVESTYQVWLTDAGRAEVLMDGYESPIVAKAVAAADARWINLLAAGTALSAGEIDHAEFRRRTRPAPSTQEADHA